jgi:site-specific recombinase XerD
MRRDCWIRRGGPLATFAETFKQELEKAGHSASSLKHHLVLMGQLDHWLLTEGLTVVSLSGDTAQCFLDSRRTMGQARVPTIASLTPLLEFLRTEGAVAPEQPVEVTPMDHLLVGYHQHLVGDRALAPTTVRRYMTFARRFLAARAEQRGATTGVEGLTSAEVSGYMLDMGARLVVESTKREAADLRALLRYLYLRGLLDTDLGTAMPPVAAWRGRSLPPTMNPAEVDDLIATCERSSTTGRRDRVVLVLMARLGLRAGEVAALELDDISWRVGEIIVRGKARRRDRLPLPGEVGEALAEYLRDARPSSTSRRVVLTLYAPFRPIHPGSITSIVYRACRRAGLPQVGGHRLRHALATEMLRQGGDLLEIAQVLRHSDLGTTAGYAKVDRAALRSVARTWPGAGA